MKTNTTLLGSLFNAISKRLEVIDEDSIALEKEVSECIIGALLHSDTTILISMSTKKYVLKNLTLHLTITINQNSAMIKITNTVHNTAEKYRVRFVDDMVDLIIKDYDARMDTIFDDVDTAIFKLIQSTNSMIKAANGNLVEKVDIAVKQLIQEYQVNS